MVGIDARDRYYADRHDQYCSKIYIHAESVSYYGTAQTQRRIHSRVALE